MNRVSPIIWIVRLFLALASIGALLALQGVFARVLNPYSALTLQAAGIAVILAVSLNLINGITGQFSLGHAGFMAIGAYVAGVFTVYCGPRLVLIDGIVFLISILLGALAAGIAGFMVGLPSLRLRGDYLAIATLGFGEIIRVVIRTIKEVGGASGFSGGSGMSGALPNIPKYTTSTWVFGAAALCILCVWSLSDSAFGRSMRAVREDEVAAEAAGVNTTRVKVTAFVISAMWAGVAGALQIHLQQGAHPDSFGFLDSVKIVVMVVMGGLGSITGSAIAAFGMRFLEEYLREPNWALGTAAALSVLTAVLALPRVRAKSAVNALDYLRWAAGPVIALGAIGYVGVYQRAWLQDNAPILRWIIYAMILIVLMLLRPQGLFGRGELGRHIFGRRNRNAAVAEQLHAEN